MRLKRRILAALLLSLSTAFAYADPPARAARLNYIHGTVSFAAAVSPETWAVAVLNRPLTSGDRLWTDRDGYAELHVGSTAVRLAPNTSLDILTLDDDTLQLRLAQGDVNIRLREAQGNSVEVDTPNAAVLLEEPGSYRVSTLAAEDATNVLVHAGRAQVLALHSANSVSSGQQATLRGASGIASQITAAHRDAFDQWSAELDQREDDSIAARYVSPHMTGYEDLDAYGTWRTLPDYGAVWVPAVAAGWAPYRHGHWVWIEPWGWTWIDDAPWGFAPFHYGRWIWLNGYWAWAPGPRIVRPVYAPALVAFVGGSNWSVSIGAGPAVGWFPLGWREPFFPWYRTSTTYVREINVTHVKNITIYNNVTRVNYANQALPQAVTVVPRDAFVSARPVARSALKIPSGHATRAPLIKGTPAQPEPSSWVARRAETRPPESAIRREVLGTRRAQRPRDAQHRLVPSAADRESDTPRAAVAPIEPRVRVIERERDVPGKPRGSIGEAPGHPARDTVKRDSSPPKPRTQPVPAPQQRSAPEVQRERRSADSDRDVRPPHNPDRTTRTAPGSAQRARPPTPEVREGDRERRAAPRPERSRRSEPQSRSQRPVPEAARRPEQVGSSQSPIPQSPRPVQPQAHSPRPEARGFQQAPRSVQPQMDSRRPEPRGSQHVPRERGSQAQSSHPQAHGPRQAPPPQAGGRPKREQRNPRD